MSNPPADPTLLNEPLAGRAEPMRGEIPTMDSSLGRAGAPVFKASGALSPGRKSARLPEWAIAASVLWLAMALTYLALVGGVSPTPSAISGVIAGMASPLVLIWLIALLQGRAMEVDAITHPVRRQLAALLAPGVGAETRVRRVTEALAEQAEHLRTAANVALEDSSAAMNAIIRQSGELRRLSGEAMTDIGKVGKTAEQTLLHLREALTQVNQQTGAERERALALVTDLEKHIREVLGQVDQLSSSYESKLARLSDTSGKLEERTRILVSISDGVENKVDKAAGSVLGDLDRLEASVAELGQRSAAIAHMLSRPVESLERAAGHLDSNMRQSQEMLQNATRSLEKIGDNALSRASTLVATLSDRLSSMELVGAKLVSVGASAQADTGRYVSQIEAAAERIRAQAESGQQHLRQTLREFGQIAEQSLNQSDALVERLRDGADHLAEAMSEGEKRFDVLADGIEERAARLRDLGKDAAGQMEEARLVLDAAQDGFSGQLDRLGNLSERLGNEIGRAQQGASRLGDATELAGERTANLLRVSETTTATLSSVAGVLTEQQQSVVAMAESLGSQINALTAALAGQQEEIRRAATTAGEQGDRSREVLRAQVAAIADATMEMATRLDGLQGRLGSETGLLTGMTDLLDVRLTELIGKVEANTGVLRAAGHDLGASHEALSTLATQAQERLSALSGQLDSTRTGTTLAMDDVAARLVALRTELGVAEHALQQTGSGVVERQAQLHEQGESLNVTLADTLARIESLTGGLESAGQAVAAQGQAAGVLIAQAEQQLTAAGHELISNTQTAEMALAGVGEETVRQQSQLEMLRQQVLDVAAALETARIRVEAGEQTLLGSGSRARGELEETVARLAEAASALQGQVGEGVASLQSAEGTFRTVKGEMISHTGQVDDRIRVLQQDMVALQNILAGLTTKSDALAGSLAQQAVQAELASGRLQNASTVADQSTALLMARMAELGRTAAEQQEVLTHAATAVSEADQVLRTGSERSQASLKQTLDQLATAGLQADEMIGQMVEKLRSAGTSVGSEASGAQTLLGEIAAALRATADEFGARVETAEGQMNAALGSLDRFGRQLGSETVVLQDNIHALTMSADQARQELLAGQGDISTTGQEVARVLAGLAGEIERLGETGARNAGQLKGLSEGIALNTGALQESGSVVQAQQQLLAEQLARTQQSMREMGSDVEGVRSIVGQMTDHAAARLAEVSALFAQRVREGEEMVGGATGRLTDLERRLMEATGNLEARHDSVMTTATRTLERLEEVDGGFVRTVARGETAQAELAGQAEQNARLLEGLARLTGEGTAALDAQAQRLAMLAQQAASDSSRMVDVTGRIEQQQVALRHAAEAAVAVLHSVQAQLQRSGESGISLIDAAEAKVSDVLVAMTDRLAGLGRQNDDLMAQLRDTVGRFTEATSLMHESTLVLGRDIGGAAEQLHTRALDLTAAGQTFDRDLKARLTSIAGTQEGMERHFSGFSRQLAEMDSRASSCLIDLDRRSQEAFGRMQTGMDLIAAMPAQIDETENMLAAQVQAARQELAALRADLVEIGREVQDQVTAAAGTTGELIGNLQDAGMHSRLMAEQIDSASRQMGVAAESTWQAIRAAVTDSNTGMEGLVENLAHAEDRTTTLAQVARGGVEGLLERVSEMGLLLDASLTRINYNYEQLARGGFNALSQLTQELDTSTSRLSESTELARAQLGAASAVVDQHQSTLMQGTAILSTRLAEVQQQLEQLRDGFAGLDARLEFVGPALASQQDGLEGFLASVDRTLNQVAALQALSRELAGEHLELAARVQDSESRLMHSAGELEGKLGRLDVALSGAVLARLVQASEHAQAVEGHLGHLTTQAGRLDDVLAQVRQSLAQDVGSLQTAEQAIAQVAENTTGRMLEVGTALNATLSQLQRGGQISHAGLMQTNEETQRLVVRLEQVRALIKNMMGGISTDLNEWQSDMRRRLTGIAGELASPAARASIPPLPVPAAPRVRVAASGVSSTSTQLTTEALHAVAVDLYRLLQAEVPDLRRSLMPPAARRTPMTPEDARSYTLALLGQNSALLTGFVRDLYRNHIEFHQYVDRYLARFEAQYDVLVRGAQGATEAAAYRTTEVGRLYEMIAGAIERRSIAAPSQQAAV